MTDSHGTIHWSELMTRDVEAAKDYYAAVCGWAFDGMDAGEGTYWVAKRGGNMVAGIMDLSAVAGMAEVPVHWFTYIAVDDVDAAVAHTREMGGRIERDCFDVPGVGRIAIVSDPSGAAVGIMTPAAAG